MSTKAMTSAEALPLLLRELRLPSVCSSFMETADQAQRGGWSYIEYLKTLCEIELIQRKRHRVERNLRRSQLPASKTLSTLDAKRLPLKVQRILPVLCEGSFVSKGENILAFGLPGRGKTHLCSAIGHELIHRGYQVLFVPTFRLVQSLLLAKRDLRLDTELRRLDRFEVVILDDIGYVQQERDEMEVLFTFLSERYERRSIMITSNLVFSEWDKIFKNPMTTAAAIDRLIHHSTIIEMIGKKSVRAEEAEQRNEISAQSRPKSKSDSNGTDNARKEDSAKQ